MRNLFTLARKSLLVLVVFAMLIYFVFPSLESNREVHAQANNFDTTVEFGTQSAWNKKIPLKITVKANIDSSRTQIDFIIPAGIKIEKGFDDFFPMAAGQTVELDATIIPENKGFFEIKINTIAWQSNTNLSSSSVFNIEIAEDLTTIPKTSNYFLSVGARIFVIGAMIVAGLGLLAYTFRKTFIYLKTFLKPPEIV